MRRKMSIFTLIELMVVISIIAVLMTLLLPSLRRAKAVTMGAVCANKLKQLAVSANLYTDQYDGYMPPSYYASLGCWPDILQLGGVLVVRKNGYWLSQEENPCWCPVSPYNYNKRYSYGFNSYIATLKLSLIPRPSSIFMFMDTGSGTYSIHPYYSEAVKNPRFHYGGGEFLYCDGHVEWLAATRYKPNSCWIP